eukprot:2265412-Alexandrium_andersonii.AAC.1
MGPVEYLQRGPRRRRSADSAAGARASSAAAAPRQQDGRGPAQGRPACAARAPRRLHRVPAAGDDR